MVPPVSDALLLIGSRLRKRERSGAPHRMLFLMQLASCDGEIDATNLHNNNNDKTANTCHETTPPFNLPRFPLLLTSPDRLEGRGRLLAPSLFRTPSFSRDHFWRDVSDHEVQNEDKQVDVGRVRGERSEEVSSQIDASSLFVGGGGRGGRRRRRRFGRFSSGSCRQKEGEPICGNLEARFSAQWRDLSTSRHPSGSSLLKAKEKEREERALPATGVE